MHSQSLCKRALELHRAGRLAEAEALYAQVLAAEPEDATGRYLLGVLRSQQGRHTEAQELIGVALRQEPDNPAILFNYANALMDGGRLEEALAMIEKALALEPVHGELLNSRGAVLQKLNRFEEALASYDRAVAAMPTHSQAHYNRAMMLWLLRRPEEAVNSLTRAVVARPDYAEAYYFRGIVLCELRQFAAAVESYNQTLRLQPNHVAALNNRGNILRDLERHDLALASFDRALKLEPDNPYIFGGAAFTSLRLCDWKRTAVIAGELKYRILHTPTIVAPFALLGYDSSPALQLANAKKYLHHMLPVTPPPMWHGADWRRSGKIRLAYLSGDFRTHAIAYQAAGLFEHHDHARFEVHGISYGHDDGSALRGRLIKAFDRFHDVRQKSDREVAELLHALEIDIAVDLNGYTGDARPAILSHRPCPVQVNYLGYPGSMGADFLDYVIADETIAPFDQQPFFTEQIVHLPHCYMANDAPAEILGQMRRADAGLPETGFVFCAFNTHWKITARFFDIWMRLLAQVPGSVLWLKDEDAASRANLQAEAVARGIAPERLIFAPRQEERQSHLARHALADLFLDTLPYNAHATASDALLTGLPLVTCLGSTFAGRVAASLLKAIGLPELVAATMEDYEALALALAQDANRLSEIRGRLTQNRRSYPLFDTKRFCRSVESAYVQMLAIKQGGGEARSFRVTDTN